ncbi:MAG: glutamine-hydrolyzing carbamoyl-phosphate synthase small subunit [Deltaproteobacteria bacterium]|nr:glutamine-hydrolyzing carbamoyl-phosphate synthase small subunit [Deltaproteobacteria bacterium]
MRDERAVLALADGTTFVGRALGARGITTGEVVFTTAMSGYQEVLTDPSYAGQIVTMTAPEIGNTGVNTEDDEDPKPRLAGFVVRESSPIVSSWRATDSLDAYLARHGVVAIEGIDTRALTRHIRDNGAQNGAIGTMPSLSDEAIAALVRRAKDAPSMVGLDLATAVSTREPYTWREGTGRWHPSAPGATLAPKHDKRVVAIDFGLKRNILRCLVDAGCDVTVVPATTSAQAILDLKPDGVFVSNGPGDPAALGYAVDTLRALVEQRPVFGICLGHQLLARAFGASTSKLRFGHRGINQPVRDLTTGHIEITTHNHGFVVDEASLGNDTAVTHLHLNDGAVEGIAHRSKPAFSVQYHPEAAAGPHDSLYLFERFVRMIEAGRL